MIKSLLEVALNTDTFADDAVVCTGNSGRVSWKELQTKTNFWLDKIEHSSDQKIAIYCNDGLKLVAALFATWRLGKTAVVPANTLPDSLSLLQQETTTWLGDLPDVTVAASNRLPTEKADKTSNNSTALTLYTSGSSGSPKAINKTFAQLDAELAMLEAQWGNSIENSLFLGTVSHHHMYGLPFRLLWPLCSGRSFVAEELNYLEQFNKWADRPITLITSPAHLENLPEAIDRENMRNSLMRVFSAGAPLSERAARQSCELFGEHVTEIYGSTETGAVAWQQQLKNHEWQALSGVNIDRNPNSGHLLIKTPSVNAEQWFESADMCELTPNNGFILKGRSDTIVKVAGKRISLTAIEQQLEQHPFIDKAKALFLAEKKSRIGAVIRLNATGNAELIDRGKRQINRELSYFLEGKVERVGIPRYWRYVSNIPVNTQGKINTQHLKTLFFPEQQPRLPNVERQLSIDNQDSHELILKIPDNLYYFAGHFPGRSILPGVVQLSWVKHFGKQIYPQVGDFLRLEAIKFQEVILPSATVTLKLYFDQQKGKLNFHYYSGSINHSSGRMVFCNDK